MLAGQPTASRQLDVGAMPVRPRPEKANPLGPRLLAFGCTLALVVVYALRGGSYDIVVFEEQGLVLWFTLAVGIALGLVPRRRLGVPALLLLGALAAYAGWTALSVLWTNSPELTVAELVLALDYLGLAALLCTALSRETWRAAAAGLAAGALIVCVLAVASRLAPSLFPPDRVGEVLHISRLSYPFGYWNAASAWGSMAVALGLTWSAHERARTRRALMLALVPVAGLMVYLAYSRAGIGGCALAVLASVAFSRNRFTVIAHALVAAVGTTLAILAVRAHPEVAHAAGTRGAGTVAGALLLGAGLCAGVAYATSIVRVDRWRVPERAVRPLGAIGAVVVLVPAVALGPPLVSHAWRSFKHQSTGAVSVTDPAARLKTLSGVRYALWKSSLKVFAAHPVGGTGAGTFEFSWNQRGNGGDFVRDAHNIWLENMTELGAPGLLLIVLVSLAALALGFAVRRRARRSATAGMSAAFVALFAVYLLHASVDWMWEIPAVTVLAVGAISILAGRLCRDKQTLWWPVRAGLASVALVVCLVHVPGLLSTTEIRRSQAAARAGNGALGLAWANDAVDSEPWSASAYEQRGLVLESAGRLSDAARDVNKAIDHERQNFSHWLILARIETERGRLAAATKDYKRARQLRPFGSVFLFAPYFSAQQP